jgi:hypothetical protein
VCHHKKSLAARGAVVRYLTLKTIRESLLPSLCTPTGSRSYTM